MRAQPLLCCLALCSPMGCSPPGSSVHGILQALILECVAISFSVGSSQTRNGPKRMVEPRVKEKGRASHSQGGGHGTITERTRTGPGQGLGTSTVCPCGQGHALTHCPSSASALTLPYSSFSLFHTVVSSFLR